MVTIYWWPVKLALYLTVITSCWRKLSCRGNRANANTRKRKKKRENERKNKQQKIVTHIKSSFNDGELSDHLAIHIQQETEDEIDKQ